MNLLLLQILNFKPDFLPKWIFLLLIGLCVSMLFCAGLVGLWFASTEIQLCERGDGEIVVLCYMVSEMTQ